MEEGLGAGFWVKMLGLIFLGGIAAMLMFFLIGSAWYRWGAIGSLIFFFAVIAGVTYVVDRRKQKEYDDLAA